MTGVFSKPKTKTPEIKANPPALEDTDRAQQDALNVLLKRKGRLSTQKTGEGGAPVGATSASQLMGL